MVGVSRELSEGMAQTRGDKPVTKILSVEAFSRDPLSVRTRKPVEQVTWMKSPTVVWRVVLMRW